LSGVPRKNLGHNLPLDYAALGATAVLLIVAS
jgi:hypothetical protein